ncbi:hypothetical protein GKQ23_06685 [Erwinia sp. E602]|uniref:hypothetical protein n=1 Tax=Erwinia sp. E602 TaxID=2675378 RepID=UPI001BA62EF9|nr:hypothetical protein [Erwinia sp. E602]QUG74701.1 hypothetical protein GKQ23_06685 [Erwinia sp. E602]
MKKILGISLLSLAFIGAASLYVDYSFRNSVKEDEDACKFLTPSVVAKSVVANLTNKKNSAFPGFNLKREDVIIDTSRVSIQDTMAYVPFTLTSRPGVKYVAMPRCADLNDVEYGEE